MAPPRPQTPKFLLVGTSESWRDLARSAASSLGAVLDEVQDVPGAIAWMLSPDRVYDHVLASTPLCSREIDALVGMLDEVTLRPTPLLLLGCTSCGSGALNECLPGPDLDALCRVLDRQLPVREVAQPAIAPAALVAALHAGGLRMRFQPILRAADLVPIGVEALARVHTADRGILHPNDFIPATIAAGRERVLAGIAAARTFLDIGQLRGSPLFASINLPLGVVMHPGSLTRGVELCAVAGISPSSILVEVLETSTAPDMVQLEASLDAWRDHGFRMAIDDAGPALPHWRAMLDLPFDVVKLDGALVADPSGHGLLATIVGEAHDRGRFIIAEGIENEACLERVQGLGVDALQGFIFSRPLPALAVPVWLATRGVGPVPPAGWHAVQAPAARPTPVSESQGARRQEAA